MKPHVKLRKKGEARTAPPASHDDAMQTEALEAAAAVVRVKVPTLAPMARTVADWVLTAYIMKRAEQAFKDPVIMRALTSERPWDMVRLVDKSTAEEAAIAASLPIVGALVAEMDPSGTKPLFAYSRPEIMRLFEAVIWCWEESQAERTKIDPLNDQIPY